MKALKLQMKRFRYIALATGLLGLVSCNNQQANTSNQNILALPTIEVPERTVTAYASYPVSIEGRVYSAIRAKVPGYITRVFIDEGQRVKKGQTLFTLETQALTEDAGAAQANVNAAQVEVDRLKPLVDKGIISPVQLETAQARLAQAKANYKSITANIGYATIKSPIDGNVGAINYRQGALVSPGDPTPLTAVTDVQDIYAFFSLNERDYLDLLRTTEGESLDEKIKNLPPVELDLVNGERYPEKGRIETITGQVNSSTGTVSFRATFPNKNRILAHGNSGRIRIPRQYENTMVVPQTSTTEQQGRTFVYKVRGDTIAVLTSITVIDRVGDLYVVSDGIKAGDKIVAEGLGKLRDMAPIKPQPVPFDSVAGSLKVVFK
jgi:membrane fusion protein, multidrug efflux system